MRTRRLKVYVCMMPTFRFTLNLERMYPVCWPVLVNKCWYWEGHQQVNISSDQSKLGCWYNSFLALIYNHFSADIDQWEHSITRHMTTLTNRKTVLWLALALLTNAMRTQLYTSHDCIDQSEDSIESNAPVRILINPTNTNGNVKNCFNLLSSL